MGIPTIRIIVFWGLYWGPPVLGNYHMGYLIYCPLSPATARFPFHRVLKPNWTGTSEDVVPGGMLWEPVAKP